MCKVSKIHQYSSWLLPHAVGAGGGFEHVDIVSHGASFFGGPAPGSFSALTSTGIACPVPSPKALCPRTVSS